MSFPHIFSFSLNYLQLPTRPTLVIIHKVQYRREHAKALIRLQQVQTVDMNQNLFLFCTPRRTLCSSTLILYPNGGRIIRH